MANAKTFSFVDAVQKQAAADLEHALKPILEALTKSAEVIDILNRRTLDLNRRVQILEQRLGPPPHLGNGGGGEIPQRSDAS